MPRFGYRAYDQTGVLRQGEVECESREAALHALARRGEMPVEVSEGGLPAHQRWWEREVIGAGRLSHARLSLFTRELATLLKADIPVDEALRVVHLQPALPARVRKLTRAILDDVVAGRSLSEAVAAQEPAFPAIYARLVQSGEASGTLAEVFEDLAGFYERSAEIRARLGSALVYPAVLLAAAAIALAVILGALLPTVVSLFEEAGAELPAPVAALAVLEAAAARHWLPLSVVTGLSFVGLAAAFRSEPVRDVCDRWSLRLPVLASVIARSQTARFARTLATLTKNGVSLPDALRMTSGVLGNRVFRAAALQAGEDLMQGSSLSASLGASGLFSDLALRLTAVGEQTGQLDVMLARVADILEASFQTQLQRLTALLAPLLTIVIGVLVGGLLLTVMSAIISVNELALQ